MEALPQKCNLQQFPALVEDPHEIVQIISDILKKYFLPVHVEVLCVGYRKHTGSDLPFREFGYSSAAEFLRNGCGGAFDVTRSQTDKSVFYVAPKGCLPNGKSLTLKRDPIERAPSESDRIRKVLQVLNHGNETVPRRKKSVPPQFKQYLRFLISRHPAGITSEGLVTEFLRTSGSPLSYEMYGYTGHLEMFKDLSDVFTIREADGESILYPTSVQQKLVSPVKVFRKTFVKPIVNPEPLESCPGPARVKASQTGESLRFHDVGKIELESGGSLIYVRLNGCQYIPTPCLASLAGLPSDNILETLEAQNIEVQGLEVLRETVQQHTKLRYEIALVSCPLVITKAGALIKEIPLLPLKSIEILLSFLGLRSADLENCIRKIRESLAQV